ncbi:VOC family protein [Dactylosporangium sp. CA-092794]|uniref:VOC family protein n=1 Tax=Dactylosporangium sp. CA-092794 TaxID=3239929 RepID=UPI003D909E1C
MADTTTGAGAADFSGIHHLTVPVPGLGDNVRWYETCLRATRMERFDHRDASGALTAVVLRPPDALPLIELRHDPDVAARVRGYLPFSLGVATRSDLDAWAAYLDAHGIEHGAVVERRIGQSLDIPCPDTGMAIRLYTDPVGGIDAVEFRQ